ncbi:Helix-turn-helix XRE-family transcriptional regulator (plasmid) [Candidatus Trichorickettsia mobilis]|uniref:addiction module antidote protein n=1 Tax=Candidatus Trichorickettsia mobilis TaxID=1346319 RepID=UPI002B2571F2|nr:addiction module antidote protein [Candidatus Trichorickettsia mobilis]WPY01603.1 Helix-turn-helix XRE-family transcriptional regulator [Candidatus Trichorickettsia mobilis]
MQNLDNYLRDQFQDDENVKEYINAALEQYFEDHNKELFLASLKEVIKAKGGVTEFSKHVHINRQHIYRMLSDKGNPSFENIGSLLIALGLKLQVETTHSTH